MAWIAAASVALGACQSNDVYIGWMASRVELERVDANPAGPHVGWQGSNGGAVDGFFELALLEDADEDLTLGSLNMGMRTRPAVAGALEVRGQTDLGITSADLESLRNDNSLISFGLGLQPAIRIHRDVSVVALVGYRFYFDTTDPTTCNDGTTSTSIGSGTCSHHGGIRHYNEMIGDGGGPELSVGLRLSF